MVQCFALEADRGPWSARVWWNPARCASAGGAGDCRERSIRRRATISDTACASRGRWRCERRSVRGSRSRGWRGRDLDRFSRFSFNSVRQSVCTGIPRRRSATTAARWCARRPRGRGAASASMGSPTPRWCTTPDGLRRPARIQASARRRSRADRSARCCRSSGRTVSRRRDQMAGAARRPAESRCTRVSERV